MCGMRLNHFWYKRGTMNKAVFLDRDGTINVEKNYLYRIEDFEFLPGALEGLRRFKEAGYLLIIVTNQSGIGRGYYTEKQYKELETWMCDQLKKYGAAIDGIYYCPHLPDAKVEQYRKECNCRKPKKGMFEAAIREYDIDVSESIAIGDNPRDLALCENGVTTGYLVYAKEFQKETLPNIHYIEGGIEQAASEFLEKKEPER